MNYQIKKVANGYMVLPAYSIINRDLCGAESDIFVFRTWQQASAWLNAKFKDAK